MSDKDRVLETLKRVGFVLEEREADDCLPQGYVVSYPHTINSYTGGPHIVGLEFKGSLPVIEDDFYYTASNGSLAMLALLAMVMPEETLAVDCGDLSGLVNSPGGEFWETISEATVRDRMSDRDRLHLRITELIENWEPPVVAWQPTKAIR